MKALDVKPFWFKFTDYYKHLQYVKAGTYAFGFFDKSPLQNEWPHQLENIIYMGESATNEPTIDRKNVSSPRNGKVEFAFFKRMKKHMSNILNANKISESDSTWRKIYYENFGYGIQSIDGTKGKILYVGVLFCPEKEIYPKAWVKLVEQELIYEYQNAFGRIPLLNTKEKNNSSDSMKKQNSLSQIIYREKKLNDITRFMVD